MIRISQVVADMEKSRYGVRNIDTGTAHRVPLSYLHKSCDFLENLPVSQCRSTINTICSIPANVVPFNTTALRLLQKLYDEESELEVQFFDSDCSSLDLLDIKAAKPSLIARMLPMIFKTTPTADAQEPAKELPEAIDHVPEVINASQPVTLKLPPSPPNTPIIQEKSKLQIKRHYFDELKLELIPLGDNIQILILNAVGLRNTGSVTACYFSSEKIAENFQSLLNRVVDFGNNDKLLPGYLPE